LLTLPKKGASKVTTNRCSCGTRDQTVRGFGILDDSKARQEWGWKGDYTNLSKVVEDFVKEVKDYPGRLQRLELFG
jgi:hypothetical protein